MRRRRFCRWALRRNQIDPNFARRILFTDECRFGRESAWNFRNEHYWAERNPFVVMPRNFQVRFSVHLWAGIIDGRLIGPFQIFGNLSGPRYNDFLQNHLPHLLAAEGININDVIFMQDGHPAHCTRRNIRLLHNIFGERVISLGSRDEWPPRSPNLNPLDFFLWGYLKAYVYRTPLENIEQLHQRLAEVLDTVTPEMLTRCSESFITRARWCRRRRGGHFESRLP